MSPLSDNRPVNEGDSDAEQVRQSHISHEASIKSMGLLYYLGAVIGLFYTILLLFNLGIMVFTYGLTADLLATILLASITIFCGGVTFLNYWVARGLRRLDQRVRTPAIVLSAIGLLGIPIGTLISIYFLWLLLSKKGQYIFSDEYAGIIALTPHIKYKTSIIVWVFVGILLFVLGSAMMALLLGMVAG